MSLWSVDDDATRSLMLAFVAALETSPPHVALRQAMVATRKTHPDPAHWAGFTVYGVPGSSRARPAPPASTPPQQHDAAGQH